MPPARPRIPPPPPPPPLLAPLLLAVACAAASSPLAAQPATGTRAFTGATIHPIATPPIEGGTLVVRDGRIVAVGPAGEVEIPADAERIDVSGKTILPGFVDTHGHYGIGPLGSRGDVNEGTGPTHPALRVMDSILPRDPAIGQALAGGITSANIMSGSGSVMSGQTAYVKLRGETVEEMLYRDDGGRPLGGMKMANGTNPLRSSERPSTRMTTAAIARALFVDAQEYAARWDGYEAKRAAGEEVEAPERDLGLEAVAEILRGERTVHHHTHRADDILTVLRLAREFGFEAVIQHGSEAWIVADEIAAAGVPASVLVVDAPGGKLEAVNVNPAGPGILERAGVKVALHTDHWIVNGRFLLREAAIAVRHGMTREAALRALTIHPAEMLRLDDRIGTLEPGKDADFLILSGDPFSVHTKIEETWILGEKVFDLDDPAQRRWATGGHAVADRYPPLEPGAGEGGRR